MCSFLLRHHHLSTATNSENPFEILTQKHFKCPFMAVKLFFPPPHFLGGETYTNHSGKKSQKNNHVVSQTVKHMQGSTICYVLNVAPGETAEESTNEIRGARQKKLGDKQEQVCKK